jgi:WXXGXW repeat (2 copies)
MKKSLIVKVLLVAVSLPLIAGCVVYQDPPPGGGYDAPPPQVEVVPVAPGPLAVWYWVPGAWDWHGRWVWVGGYWAARPRPDAIWVGGGWRWHGHRRVWVGGHWR